MSKRIAIVSGGFDPIHRGHISLIQSAKEISDEVWVILNSDNWLLKKKSHIFMDEEDRFAIVASIKGVTKVWVTQHQIEDEDMSVCETLRYLHNFIPDDTEVYFCNGGDRVSENTPEKSLCHELGIIVLYGVGGDKVQSSSSIVERIRN